MSKSIWVVVANRVTARIFATENPLGPIEEIETLLHPESRVPQQSLVSDRSGRTERSTAGRQSSDPDTAHHEHESTLFAAQVATTLAKARNDGRYGTLVLAAPPAFLGALRKALDPQTKNLVTLELDKDLALLDARTLRTHFPERLVRAQT
ncbi:protein required for attachment to host cells [Paraburkholderia bannensis]|uniref:Protein required for attachment to host cells n=1 Tax=Paraburkholderia bannensis TaxID=765414 RepID=A0A7W9TYE0_9BURK|nr:MULTISPECIES: host attachment protein [Paraburkholderia]MBB3257968.1 protein required for attachment to host cells [Paraburkholderia sp. WP4_3_2]MBB6102981.1 protein required for attachment to host cells [Paraburkholderia bannensis]